MSVPEIILRKIDTALTLKDPTKLRCVLEEIITDLHTIPNGNNCSEVNYLWGYSWYLHPDRLHSKQVEQEVERTLLLAVQQKPSMARAWLYLGHNAYDFGHYTLANQRFSRVDLTDLSSYLQLKTYEMRLCCKIHLKGLDLCLDDLEQFIVIAEQSQIEDIWPQELSKILPKSLKNIDISSYARIKILAQRLDMAGNFGDWFGEIIDKSTPSFS